MKRARNNSHLFNIKEDLDYDCSQKSDTPQLEISISPLFSKMVKRDALYYPNETVMFW